MFSNKTYTVLKHLAMIGLPLIITIYFGLSQIWNWTGTEQVMATLTLLNSILGGTVAASSVSYNSSGTKYDGELHIGTTQNGVPATMQVVFDDSTQAANTTNQPTAVLKVVNVQPGQLA